MCLPSLGDRTGRLSPKCLPETPLLIIVVSRETGDNRIGVFLAEKLLTVDSFWLCMAFACYKKRHNVSLPKVSATVPAPIQPSSPQISDPDQIALLVVDMQYFDAHPAWGEGRTASEMGVLAAFDEYFAQIDTILPRIQQLLTCFRAKEMEVIHIRVAEWTCDSRDVGRKQLVRGLVVPRDSKEANLLDAVAPIGDELIVSKSSSGVFATTNLDRLLRNLGITTLVFTGTATGGCIESAVRDAVDLGYNVVIVSDACADSTVASHELALQRMVGGLTRLLTTEQLEEQLRLMADGSRNARSGVERVKQYLPKPPETPPAPDVNPYSLIFPPALSLLPTLQNCTNWALLLVDTQRFACTPAYQPVAKEAAEGIGNDGSAYYERVEQALSNMATLLACCRRLKMPVIHMRTATQRRDGADLSRHLRKLNICPVEGTDAAAFMPLVAPQADEIVLNKPGLGIFTGTGLDELLRNLDVAHLILAGISYAGGLEGSIRSATDRGYSVVLVPDACATFHAVLQKALAGMESGIINVRDTASVTAQLDELSGQHNAD